ncbi:MAG TPA: dihydropteroate synthase [Solirubrobacteraceae bacterium]|nr:dihydropteroate synthase [Solirubrobacteraceae bacterium]
MTCLGGRPFQVMGIVNVTPDSFSDGGLFLDADAAIAHGCELVAQGADILDVGGESTRPGAEPVGEAQELRRVLPVVEGLAACGVPISIDTSKANVARAALAAGARFVNDVTALRGDPAMARVVAEGGAECCLMHMRGEPRTMQRGDGGDWYRDVVDDVGAFLEERLRFAVAAGIPAERVVLDPGIGFGKTAAHNLELLRRLEELAAIGPPLLVGTSRKSFLGRILAADGAARSGSLERGRGAGSPDAVEDPPGRAGGSDLPEAVEVASRLPATIATCVLAFERGARLLRVHDVAPVRAALVATAATLGAPWTTTTS